jgi:putative endonuclease
VESIWTVYVVRCRTGELYTGITVNLDRRIKEHNQGKGAKFTRTRRPVVLVYRESCKDRPAALRLENQIKGMRRDQKIALIQTASARTE